MKMAVFLLIVGVALAAPHGRRLRQVSQVKSMDELSLLETGVGEGEAVDGAPPSEEMNVGPARPKRITLTDHLVPSVNAKEYYATIKVGANEYKVVMDTGSVSVWLPHTTCKACAERARYDGGPDWANSNSSFLIEYSNGDWVAGIKTISDMSINGINVKAQEIGAVMVAGGPRDHMLNSEKFQFYHKGAKVDGVIGLDLAQDAATEEGTEGKTATFFDNMVGQGLVNPSRFSFYFGKPHTGNATNDSDSFMTLGEADPDFYYPPLFWLDVEQGPPRVLSTPHPISIPSAPKSWIVSVSHFQIGDMVWKCDDCVASVDTGSSKLVVPSQLYAHFEPVARGVDCQRLFSGLMPRIGFYLTGTPEYNLQRFNRPKESSAFSGANSGGMYGGMMGMGGAGAHEEDKPKAETRNFLLDPGDYVFNSGYSCNSVIVSGDDHFVFGTPFLRKYYSVFDQRGAVSHDGPRIGFAVAR